LILFFGSAIFFYSTYQGQALTTEVLRQVELDDHPKKIPNFRFIDPDFKEADLQNRLGAESRVMLVDFMYTRCQTVCLSLGSSFQNLQDEIQKRGLEQQIGFISISFDPEHDDPLALQRYQKRLQMDPHIWQILSLKQAKDRQSLLDTFGIMVIPAPLEEYEHNAAFHIVYKDHLYKIIELNQVDQAIDYALSLQRRPIP
jgi:protein SCO1/2